MVVVTIRFHKVDDVEAVLHIFARVLHSKKVPLGVAVGAVVVFEVEVIFVV